ncbi:hypothetical protein NFI96_030547, partial [Prochilodus magdalenae]
CLGLGEPGVWWTVVHLFPLHTVATVLATWTGPPQDAAHRTLPMTGGGSLSTAVTLTWLVVFLVCVVLVTNEYEKQNSIQNQSDGKQRATSRAQQRQHFYRGGEGMSVKLRFDCPAEGGMVQRSRSFTGVNTLSGRRRLSSARGSLRTKPQAGKSPRIPSSARMVGSTWGQQPEQVDRIFQALRKGLKEYLEGHQTELDFLLSQQRDTKRNSRLAFFYDLEKEIRALERYIRRLEFQISKVEELYETYCIQWRLCQGAVNMKRAFSLSPSSRASRESLLELSRNHRHSLEDMCAMEGELEILLGELQIKMKGLIGFARLCPGDQ